MSADKTFFLCCSKIKFNCAISNSYWNLGCFLGRVHGAIVDDVMTLKQNAPTLYDLLTLNSPKMKNGVSACKTCRSPCPVEMDRHPSKSPVNPIPNHNGYRSNMSTDPFPWPLRKLHMLMKTFWVHEWADPQDQEWVWPKNALVDWYRPYNTGSIYDACQNPSLFYWND